MKDKTEDVSHKDAEKDQEVGGKDAGTKRSLEGDK